MKLQKQISIQINVGICTAFCISASKDDALLGLIACSSFFFVYLLSWPSACSLLKGAATLFSLLSRFVSACAVMERIYAYNGRPLHLRKFIRLMWVELCYIRTTKWKSWFYTKFNQFLFVLFHSFLTIISPFPIAYLYSTERQSGMYTNLYAMQ